MNKKFLLPSLLGIGMLFGGVISVSNSAPIKGVDATVTAPEVEADVSRFNLRYQAGAGALSADAATKSLSHTGTWDSSFAVTDEVPTEAKKYEFSASVKTATTAAKDSRWGFVFYKTHQDWLKVFIKFNDHGSFAAIDFHGWTSGSYQRMYAGCNGVEYKNWGEWFSVWGENGWYWGGDDTSLYKVNTVDGFNFKIIVEDAVYSSAVCKSYTFQITAKKTDGSTGTLTSIPIYCGWEKLDDGAGNTIRTAIKPQIGFTCHDIDTTAVTDIKYRNLDETVYTSELRTLGTGTFVNDFANQKASIDTEHACGSGIILDTLNNTSQDFEISADISGTCAAAGNTVGFSLYYDDGNIANYFLEWAAGLSIPNCVTVHNIIGYTNMTEYNIYRGAWDAKTKAPSEWYTNLTDFGGWVTDASNACGSVAGQENFNLMRGQLTGKTVTIASGFKLSLRKHRVIAAAKLVDEFTLCVSAKDSAGVTRNWYSSNILCDAFTDPLDVASPLKGVTPKVALYAHHNNGVTSNVVFSNIKFNDVKVQLTQSAAEFAGKFLANSGCDATGVTAPSTTAWANSKTEYGYCSDAAKDTFKNASGNVSGTTVEQAAARYDYILGKYGTTNYENYASRSFTAMNPSFVNELASKPQESSTMTIIIVCAICVVSLSTYVIIKRRKHAVK